MSVANSFTRMNREDPVCAGLHLDENPGEGDRSLATVRWEGGC